MLPANVPNNSDLREPGDTSEWPPAMVLNLFYASAALRAWAPVSFIQIVQAMTKDTYSHNALDEPSDTGPCIPPRVDAQKRLLDTQNEKKAQAAHLKDLQLSTVIDGVMAFWMVRQGKENQQRTTASELAAAIRSRRGSAGLDRQQSRN